MQFAQVHLVSIIMLGTCVCIMDIILAGLIAHKGFMMGGGHAGELLLGLFEFGARMDKLCLVGTSGHYETYYIVEFMSLVFRLISNYVKYKANKQIRVNFGICILSIRQHNKCRNSGNFHRYSNFRRWCLLRKLIHLKIIIKELKYFMYENF